MYLIKAWSKTQAVLAKSSAESELYEVVNGACEGLGVNTLLRDLGQHEPKVRMHLDATAARGIVERKGLSKVRHIDTDFPWLQEQAARRMLPLYKVPGTENVSDLMTKNMTAATILGYLQRMRLEYIEGMSDIAQQLHAVREHPAERELLVANVASTPGSAPVKSRSEMFKADDNFLR